jgi:virginiamycin B lyase
MTGAVPPLRPPCCVSGNLVPTGASLVYARTMKRAALATLLFAALTPAAAAAKISLYPTPTPGSDPFAITSAFDNAGWFTENQVDKLGRIDQSGKITELALPTGSGVLGLTSTGFGTIAVAAHGTASIDEVTPQGVVTTHAIPGGLLPYAVTLGDDSGVWFTAQPATAGTNGAVGVMSPTPDRTITLYPVDGVPWGITRGADGNLWFALQRAGGGAIVRMTVHGTMTQYTIGSGSIPSGVAGDNNGNIWFTDQNHGKVGLIKPSGAVTEFAIGATSTILGIAPSPAGGAAAADPGGKALYAVTTAGKSLKVPVAGSPQQLSIAFPSGMYFTLREGKVGLIGDVDLTPGCRPPKLNGKPLAAAKKLLAAADCRLGMITRRKHRGRKGVVLSQDPRPGALYAEGYRVNLTVSR